jgi:hypothetical protein
MENILIINTYLMLIMFTTNVVNVISNLKLMSEKTSFITFCITTSIFLTSLTLFLIIDCNIISNLI